MIERRDGDTENARRSPCPDRPRRRRAPRAAPRRAGCAERRARGMRPRRRARAAPRSCVRDPRKNRGLRRPRGDERRAVEREGERHAGEAEADGDQEGRDLARHPLPEAEPSERDVRDRETEHPRRRTGRGPPVVDQVPADRRREARVDEEHRRGRGAQRRGRNAELVTDRRRPRTGTSRARARQRERQIVSILGPERDLWRGEQERADREPAPALPEEHRDGSDEGDHREPESERRGTAVDENWRRKRAEDAERRDELRLPADGDGRSGRPDETCHEQAELLPMTSCTAVA